MRTPAGLVLWAILVVVAPGGAQADGCPNPATALGVSRIVEIDTSHGPLFGEMTKYAKEDSFLKPKEVVLTFDDGPMPWITKSILDTLDTYCTKATFFSVGQMALAYPQSVKDVVARGHTLGTHTWSHPLNIARLSVDKAKDQIERGLAAVALAAGTPIAPFFRFPGLSDSSALLAHLQSRGIAAFTVDVVSNDSFIGSAERLKDRTLRQLEARQGGIILFHDIKSSTARALPEILAALKEQGYTIVQLRAKGTAAPLPEIEAELKPALAKVEGDAKRHSLLPFFGASSTMRTSSGDEPAVTQVAPEPRSRISETTPADIATNAGAVTKAGASPNDTVRVKKRRFLKSASGARDGGWSKRKKDTQVAPTAVIFGL